MAGFLLDDYAAVLKAQADGAGRAKAGLSSIFKWFGEDFVARYGTEEKFSGHGASQRAAPASTSGYFHASDGEYPAGGRRRN